MSASVYIYTYTYCMPAARRTEKPGRKTVLKSYRDKLLNQSFVVYPLVRLSHIKKMYFLFIFYFSYTLSKETEFKSYMLRVLLDKLSELF